jgi:hypothetical protein
MASAAIPKTITMPSPILNPTIGMPLLVGGYLLLLFGREDKGGVDRFSDGYIQAYPECNLIIGINHMFYPCL